MVNTTTPSTTTSHTVSPPWLLQLTTARMAHPSQDTPRSMGGGRQDLSRALLLTGTGGLRDLPKL